MGAQNVMKFYVSKIYFYSTVANILCHKPSLVVLYKHRQTLVQVWAAHRVRSGQDGALGHCARALRWATSAHAPGLRKLWPSSPTYGLNVWFLLCSAMGLGWQTRTLQVPGLIRATEPAEALCIWLMASQALNIFNSDIIIFLMDVYSDYCYAVGFFLIVRKLAIHATGSK